MKSIKIILIIYCLTHYNCMARENVNEHKHNNELSIAVGIVPLVAENEVTAGFHIHYIKGLGTTKSFGLGLSAETILDEHKHYTFSIVFQYYLTKGLAISYSPGLLIRKEQADYQYQFASHIEAAYEIEMGEFHIGPVAEIGIEKNGIHFMVGLHIGIDF